MKPVFTGLANLIAASLPPALFDVFHELCLAGFSPWIDEAACAVLRCLREAVVALRRDPEIVHGVLFALSCWRVCGLAQRVFGP